MIIQGYPLCTDKWMAGCTEDDNHLSLDCGWLKLFEEKQE